MRDKIFGLLAISICSTALLVLPARADLAVKAGDPAETTTRSGDDSGAQVDSFWGDVGNFFGDVGKQIVNKEIDKINRFIPRVPNRQTRIPHLEAEVDEAESRQRSMEGGPDAAGSFKEAGDVTKGYPGRLKETAIGASPEQRSLESGPDEVWIPHMFARPMGISRSVRP